MVTRVQDMLGTNGLETIRQGIANAEQAIQLAELTSQAGIDVSQALQRAKETRDKLLRIKNTFYPGQ